MPPADGSLPPLAPESLPPRFLFWTGPGDEAGLLTRRIWTCYDGSPLTPRERRMFLSFIRSADRRLCRTAYDEARRTGRPYEAEFDLHHPDGSVRRMLDIGVPCPLQPAVPLRINGVTVDITRLATAEHQFRRRTEQLQRIGEFIDDTFFGMSADFRRVLFMGPSYGRLSGLDPARLNRDPLDWMRALVEEDRPKIRHLMREVSRGRLDQFRVDSRLKARTGGLREVVIRGRVTHDERGRPEQVLGVVTDVTAQREAERALRLSEERFQLAMKGANDGLFDWDIVNDQVYFSPRWKEMLGFSDAELPNDDRSWWERIHPDSRARVRRYLRDFLAGRIKTYALEHRLRAKDGSYRWILARASLVRDPRGKATRMVGFHTDITEQKNLERQILEAAEAERRDIGRDLHDDLGQRFTALELMSQALIEKLRQGAPDAAGVATEMGRLIRESVTHVRRLSHGLAPALLDGQGLVEALRELTGMAREAGGLRTSFMLRGDVRLGEAESATHLYRIAQEAVTNVLRHGRARRMTLSLIKTRAGVQLRVRDNGRGLPPGPGSTAADGRGLQVMRERARLLGASLELKSRPGKGVTVTCLLPQSR